MKKSCFLVTIFLWIVTFKITAQQLTPYVTSSSGGFYDQGSGMLSFTVGEMAEVETYTSPSVILTQGFQQYWDLGTYVIAQPDHPFSFSIYPNLSNGIFNLVTESEENENIEMCILDLLGKEIFNTSYFHVQGRNIEAIDVSNAGPGMYLVVLREKKNMNSPGSHFIQKIQIIK
jgi:hypothetical protein